MEMQGEAIYKGFPVIDEGQEYRWSCTHKRWDLGCPPI
jgi:hypothetical protein